MISLQIHRIRAFRCLSRQRQVLVVREIEDNRSRTCHTVLELHYLRPNEASYDSRAEEQDQRILLNTRIVQAHITDHGSSTAFASTGHQAQNAVPVSIYPTTMAPHVGVARYVLHPERAGKSSHDGQHDTGVCDCIYKFPIDAQPYGYPRHQTASYAFSQAPFARSS